MANHECKRLHDALTDLRSRLDPPQRDTTFQGAQAPVVMDPRDRTPDAMAEVHASIRQVEQAIREAGCDPNATHDDDDRDDVRERQSVGAVHYDGREQAGPPLGVQVSTQDGKDLGRVREVLGDYVRVASDDEEHWFLVETLGPIQEDAIRTTFPGSDVHTHAVAPPDRYEESPYNDGDLTAEEREQRAIVLRQTAEQREGLRSDGVTMPEEGDTVGEPVEQELARMRGGQEGDRA